MYVGLVRCMHFQTKTYKIFASSFLSVVIFMYNIFSCMPPHLLSQKQFLREFVKSLRPAEGNRHHPLQLSLHCCSRVALSVHSCGPPVRSSDRDEEQLHALHFHHHKQLCIPNFMCFAPKQYNTIIML